MPKHHPSGLAEICIFAENAHDADAIGVFVHAVRSDVRTLSMKKPVSLQRGVSIGKISGWADRIGKVLQARGAVAGHRVIGALVHRDADAPDPSGRQVIELDREFRSLPAPVRAVVPVQAIEAWWLAYPKAVEETRASWKGCLDDPPGDTEAIAGPKGRLQRKTRGRAGDSRGQYQESDSPQIARQIVKLPGWQDSAPASLTRAIRAAKAIGQS